MQTATSNLLARVTACPTVADSTILLTHGLGAMIETIDGDQQKLGLLCNDLLHNPNAWAGAITANTEPPATSLEQADGSVQQTGFNQALGGGAAFAEKEVSSQAEPEEAVSEGQKSRRKYSRSAAASGAPEANGSVEAATAPRAAGRKARQPQAA